MLIAAMSMTPMAAQSDEEAATDTLFGIEWRLVELAGTEPIENHVPTLAIQQNGRAGGNSGCNVYFASATVEDDTISFSDVGSTFMACDEPVMEQEQALFDALKLAARFKLEDGSLELLDHDGALLMRLAASA